MSAAPKNQNCDMINNKTFKKNLIFFLFGCVIFYGGLSIFLNTAGKNRLNKLLCESLGEQITFRRAFFLPFLTLRITGVVTSDAAIEELVVSPNISSFFSGKFGLHALLIKHPRILITRNKDGFKIPFRNLLERKLLKQRAAGNSETSESAEPVRDRGKSSKPAEFFCDKLLVVNGALEVRDESAGKERFFELRGIQISISSFHPSANSVCKFSVNAHLKTVSQGINDFIDFSGWVNFPKKAMQAQCQIKSIPYHDVAFILPHFLQTDALGIQNAVFSFDAKMNSKDNELVMNCLVFLDQYVLQSESGSISQGVLLQSLIRLFHEKGKTAPFEFTVKTKFDNPRIDLNQIGNQALSQIGSITFIVGKEAMKKAGSNAKEVGIKAADTIKKAAQEISDSPREAIRIADDFMNAVISTKPAEENATSQ